MSIFHTGDKVIYDGRDEAIRLPEPAGSEGVVEEFSDADLHFFDINNLFPEDFARVRFTNGGVSQLVNEDHLFSGDRSIYKVERKVDTVIIEMDSHVAEQLVTILNSVMDDTRSTATGLGGEMDELLNRLIDDAGIREDALYMTDADALGGHLVLRDRL